MERRTMVAFICSGKGVDVADDQIKKAYATVDRIIAQDDGREEFSSEEMIAENQDLKDQIGSLENSLKGQIENANKAGENVEELSAQLKKLDPASFKALEEQVEARTKERDEMNAAIDELVQEKAKLEERISELESGKTDTPESKDDKSDNPAPDEKKK